MGGSLWFFFLPILLEGLGLKNVHRLLLYFYLLLPGFLFFYASIKNKRVFFPKKMTILFSIFILVNFVSSLFFSFDKQVSFELCLFYTAVFLFFIFFYSNKANEKEESNFLNLLAFVFLIYSLLLVNFKPDVFRYQLAPISELQFVAPIFGSHNHLGDFLGLAMVGSLYLFLKKIKSWFILCFFFFAPFFLIAFSRSAYLALLISLFLMVIQEKKTDKIGSRFLLFFPLIFGLIVLSFFFLTVKQSRINPVLRPVNQFLESRFNLQPKEFFANRFEFFNQAIQSFYQRPLFGVGPGNYYYASKQNATNKLFDVTFYGHNIFLEILVEGGIFSLFFFCLILYLVFKNGFGQCSLFFYLLVYLFINFQTDYTYKIYGFFYLFFLLAGSSYKEKREFEGTSFFGLIALILTFVFTFILTSNLMLKIGKADLSILFYPLNSQAYKQAIQQQKEKNFPKSLFLAKNLERIAPYDYVSLLYLSEFYQQSKDKKKALDLLEKAYGQEKFASFETVVKIYLLTKEVKSSDAAKIFIEEALFSYRSQVPDWQMTADIKKQISDFCYKNEPDVCRKTGWITD